MSFIICTGLDICNKNMSYLRINVSKDVQMERNTLWKGTKIAIKNGKLYYIHGLKKSVILNMTIVSKSLYGFHDVPIKSQ
jgi:hypothetical protein